MITIKRIPSIVSQVILILSLIFGSFTPSTIAQAQPETTPAAKQDINSGITLGVSRLASAAANVPILSEEIARQAQAQALTEQPLQIKLSAEPAIYIPGKPIVITWKITGGLASKTSGLSIVVRPTDGVIPANTKVVAQTDGSVIILPKTDTGIIIWKVLDYAEFPLSFTFDLMVNSKVINNNAVLIDQPLGVTSTTQSASIQSSENHTQVTVPPNAASGNLLMGMRSPSPNALGGPSLSWNPVEIIAVDQVTAKNVTQFANPITVQIKYDENRIFDWAENDLSIYYYDPDLLDWFPMETTVDSVNNTLTVQSDHLTVFDYKANNWQSTMLPTVDTFKTADFTGAATYQINMWTPPAPGGLQPSVSLSYNSQIIDEASAFQQASWVGMGWNLETGAVTKNLHGTDGEPGDDTFSISVGGISEQLIPISSSGNITQYNTADQSFMKVESHDYDLTHTDPDSYSFIAWTKDGTRYDFKETTDVSKGNGTCNSITWRWSLSKVTDVHGNTLNYTYITETKNDVCRTNGVLISTTSEIAVYPETITYGNGKYRVNFTLSDNATARTDYQLSWAAPASSALYGTRRLIQVIAEHCPFGNSSTAAQNSSQNCPGASPIRRYELSYAPNNATNIYPNFNYSAGGKTLTLAGVQEFGSDGSTLPAVTFTYGDSMHLTNVNNGQGGSVAMNYAAWQYLDDVNTDTRKIKDIFRDDPNVPTDCIDINGDGIRDTAWGQVSGIMKCDGGNPVAAYLQLGNNTTFPASAAERSIPENMIKPTALYTFRINPRAIVVNTTVGWGIRETGTNQTIMLSNPIATTSWGNLTHQFTLPVTYNPASIKLRLECNNCFFRSFEFIQHVILYRVTSRVVTTQPTGLISTYTYQYDNASPTTVDNSAAVAGGGVLYTKKLLEFRGNAMSQMTNPEGLTTVNWFWQADGLKGRAYDTLVLQESFFDNLESLDMNNWATSGGTHTVTAEDQRDFDSSIKSVNPAANWNVSLRRYRRIWPRFMPLGVKTAVAHIRLSGVNALGDVGFAYGTQFVGLNLSTSAVSSDGTTLLPAGSFIKDEWYGVMFILDDLNQKALVRIWQLDNPNNRGEAIFPYLFGNSGYSMFRSRVNNGAIYTDSYFEGIPYSETLTRYDNIVQYDTTTGNAIPDIASTSLMTFKDLGVSWVTASSVENRNYNGDAAFVGTKQEFTYATAAQYGNLISQVESGNSGSGWSVYRTSNYEYYPNAVAPNYIVSAPARQRVLDASNTLLAETLYFYDGNTAYTTPPTKGDLTTQRVWAGGTNYAQSSMTYDPYGNVLTQSVYTEYGTATANPPVSSKQTTTTAYDTAGYNTYPVKVKNQLLQEVNTAYNYALGLPISVTDANSVTTSATYDGFGRMKTITAPGDASSTLQVNYFDTRIPVQVDLVQTVSATSAIRLSRFYDGAGRQIQTQTSSAVVNGALSNVVVDYQYNATGRLVKQTVPYTAANNALPTFNAQTFLQSYTGTTYDVIGRTLSTTAPNQTSMSYTYTDLTTTIKDPKLNQTVTTTDVWGRTTLVDAPTGPDVSYQYDTLNRLKDTMRAGSTTHINYDTLGRKMNMTDPDMGYWQYQYDALGNLKSQTDAKNQLTCLYYDALNRLDGKVYSMNGSCGTTTPTSFDVNYNYDAGANGIGRRTSMTDASGSTAWTYDLRGRLSTESKTITGAASTFDTSWTYNTGDLPVTMIYPDGETLTYGYNSDSTLKTVTSSTGGVYMNDMQYDEAGRLKLMQYGSNIINKTFNYFAWNTADMGGLLSSAVTTSTASLQNLAYSYDKNGNVLTITDSLLGPQTQTFTYDALNRILTASASGGANGLYSESYDYDSASGNLALKNGQTYTYGDPAHIHAVTSLTNGNSYLYDANGNMTQRNIGAQIFNLAYDTENRINSVTSNVVLPPTATPTPISTFTTTPTPTATKTNTPTATIAATATKTNTPTATNAATATKTNTPTATNAATATKTNTPTATNAATATKTNTPTNTPSGPTATFTPTPTKTNTPTNTPIGPTATFTPTATATQTPTGGLTYTVSKTADTNDGICDADCSLREAVSAANAHAGADMITVPAGTYNLTLTAQGDLDITDAVTIQGAGATATIISGGAGWADRIIRVAPASAANFTLSDLTIQNGNRNSTGGGIQMSVASNLMLTRVIVKNNTSANVGGGIYIIGANANLIVTDSAIVNNTASEPVAGTSGGGIYINTGASLTMTNVTISGNTSDKSGAGIKLNNAAASSLTNVTITNNTLPNNSFASDGAGFSVSGTTVTIKNTIIAGNIDLSASNNRPDCSGTFTSLGHNLIGNKSGCTVTAVAGDLFGSSASPINAQLGVLQDNGGSTLTHALQSGSPAINTGDTNGCPVKDQRGFTRDASCDMGAFEFGTLAYAPPPAKAQLALPPSSGQDFPAIFRAPQMSLAPLTSIFSGSSFVYDGDGKRVKSVTTTDIGTSTTIFVNNYYEVTDGVVTKYYYAGAQRIAMRKNGTLNYILGDHLGSTSIVTDAAGALVSKQLYTPWGETRYSSGLSPTQYQYTGQYSHTADFGLMYYNARWYDPALGRFAQADSIVPPGVQGLDRYAYVNNNPMRFTDPTGHMCREDGKGCDGSDKIGTRSLRGERPQVVSNSNNNTVKGCKPKCDGVINFLTNTTVFLDTIGAIVSLGEAAVTDIFIAVAATIAVAQPEVAPEMLAAAAYVDYSVASFGAIVENSAGGASLITTAAGDVLSGNTRISSDGLYIGKDTIVTARNTVLGLIPESNLDAAVSVSQVKYDMDRINGIKPGGALNVTRNPWGLFDQIVGYDTPLEDMIRYLERHK